MCFFLHIGGVALEGRSKLLDRFLHFTTDTATLFTGLRHHPLRMLLLLHNPKPTFEPSLQILFRMTSPWYVERWLTGLPERRAFSFVDESSEYITGVYFEF